MSGTQLTDPNTLAAGRLVRCRNAQGVVWVGRALYPVSPAAWAVRFGSVISACHGDRGRRAETLIVRVEQLEVIG